MADTVITTYCSQADVEQVFGTVNVEKWATLDTSDTSTTRTARIVLAIEITAQEMDDWLRGAHYSVPIPKTVVSGATTLAIHPIRFLNARLAGIFLHDNVLVQNVDPRTGQPLDEVTFARTSAQKYLDDITTGKRKLDL